MRAATIDFMKAFDSITRKSNWDALNSYGIQHDYIRLLKKLYGDQKATVLTEEESDMCDIKKGTKQGDPLSSLLFNTVLQTALEEDIPRWQKKRGTGIYLSDNDHDCLTNMRFADDVLLFATSKEQLQKCYAISSEVQKKERLRIQPGNTKIPSNQSSNIRKEIGIDDIKVEISTREESTEYLGQMTTFQQQETTEIRNRIRAAWATFHKYRQELTSRTCMLKHPLWAFRRSGIPDDELRLWCLDTHKSA